MKVAFPIYKKLSKLTMIIVIATISLCSTATMAQTNKYKIDDQLYEIYEQADKQRTTTEGLRLAKELYSKAIAKGDKKAQCLAYVVPVYYYEKQGDYAKFADAVKNLKAISRKNGYLQYYYFGYTKTIRYMQNHNQQLAAIDELKKMKDEAMADKYPYGISSYYQMLGNIYWLRRDYDNAKATYKQGLEYFKANVKGQDHSVFNLMLTRFSIQEENYEEGMQYVEDGLKDAKIAGNRTSLILQKARLYYCMGKKSEFLSLMDDIDEMVKKQPLVNQEPYVQLKVYQALLAHNPEEAKKWAKKIKTEEDQILMLKQIAISQGEWKSAYQYQTQQLEATVQRASDRQSGDIAEMNAKFQNEKLHSDMLEQKMKADQLMHEREKAQREMELMVLKNNYMEIRQLSMSDSIDKAKLIIDKTRLKMNNELAAKQVEVEKAQRENLESENRAQRILFVAGSLILLAIVANLVWNKRKSKRFIKQLSDKNDELTVARDKAQQSERMKTMFIQNVSHEIRTPLNAIVGFSNLLVDTNMETSDEEKSEFRNIISSNTELLTALVNDVLTLSELQSGKAGVNLSPCRPNDICRMAIKTVEHRKPADVELRFTTDVADDLTISSDARRISQVLINFLTNAEKYTTQGSITVDCSSTHDNGYITFSVTDTGCGIPEDKRQIIFGRFEKLDDFHQGMGLGLNICALIANLLGAKIGIDDTYTAGARFYLSIASTAPQGKKHI